MKRLTLTLGLLALAAVLAACSGATAAPQGTSQPAPSDQSSARQGMPDLDPTLEIGPLVKVRLWESGDRRRELSLQLPVRAAFTLPSPEFIGRGDARTVMGAVSTSGYRSCRPSRSTARACCGLRAA